MLVLVLERAEPFSARPCQALEYQTQFDLEDAIMHLHTTFDTNHETLGEEEHVI